MLGAFFMCAWHTGPHRRICNPAGQQFTKQPHNKALACIVEKKVPRDCKSRGAVVRKFHRIAIPAIQSHGCSLKVAINKKSPDVAVRACISLKKN